jgi:uncharacterized membrane protein YccC
MAEAATDTSMRLDRRMLEHVARTATAALASLLVARAVRLPEAYWAPISTLIVMQSSLGAAWSISSQRLVGTAIGAVLGASFATYLGANALTFTLAVFSAGISCAALRLERNAYRYASITIAIVMLVARPVPEWIVALHRFTEVSVGIGVGLIVTAIWREHPAQS